jgi:glycosyltransferase involved in cell wall biosynthesis
VTPLVSILIPCYNAAPYVAEAITSALAQSWSSKEIIVVDDGSSDESVAVARRFEDQGIIILSQSNSGASAARNRAFAASRGEYVKFFDADDVLHPGLIEAQMVRLIGNTTAVASAQWGRFYRDDISTFQLNPQSVWRDMDSRDWLVEAWMDARPMMQPALFLIPRTLIECSGGWNERLSLIDDFEFFTRLLCHASEVRFASDAPVYYRSGIRQSLSGQRSRKTIESACESLLLGTGYLLANRNDARARRACANILQDFVYTYYPDHADLRAKVANRVEELGGSDLPASGPRRFEQLRDILGWRLARRIQQLAYRMGYHRKINGTGHARSTHLAAKVK